MKNKKKRKGFTLVELLVVIAILAVLATVAILGYTQFTKKANIANDQAICSQMNLALQSNEALDNKAQYPHQAVEQCIEAGFILENLTPSTAKFNFAYDQENNRFMLLDDDYKFNFGDSKHTTDNFRIHVVVGNQEELKEANKKGYSTYLRKDFLFVDNTNTINTDKGIDVGECLDVKAINYNNPKVDGATVEEQKVVIRTNSLSTIVNIDAPNDVINHYEFASIVNVKSCAPTSYHEYGTVGRVEIKEGRVEAMPGCEIFCLMDSRTNKVEETKPIILEGATVHKNQINIKDKDGKVGDECHVSKDHDNGVGTGYISDCGAGRHAFDEHRTDYHYDYDICTCCGYTLVTIRANVGTANEVAFTQTLNKLDENGVETTDGIVSSPADTYTINKTIAVTTNTDGKIVVDTTKLDAKGVAVDGKIPTEIIKSEEKASEVDDTDEEGKKPIDRSCKHNNYIYVDNGDGTHTKKCVDCGLKYKPENHNGNPCSKCHGETIDGSKSHPFLLTCVADITAMKEKQASGTLYYKVMNNITFENSDYVLDTETPGYEQYYKTGGRAHIYVIDGLDHNVVIDMNGYAVSSNGTQKVDVQESPYPNVLIINDEKVSFTSSNSTGALKALNGAMLYIEDGISLKKVDLLTDNQKVGDWTSTIVSSELELQYLRDGKICSIGNSSYATVTDAINAATSGQKITVFANTNENINISTKNINLVVNKGVTTGTITGYVATVENSSYTGYATTLERAMNYSISYKDPSNPGQYIDELKYQDRLIKANSTVKLYSDVELPREIHLEKNGGDNITLDLNGHTIQNYVTGTTTYVNIFNNVVSLKVIDSSANHEGKLIAKGSKGVSSTNKTMSFENVTIDATECTTQAFITQSGVNLTFGNGTVVNFGNNYDLIQNRGTVVFEDGCTVTGGGTSHAIIYHYDNGIANFNGGTFNAKVLYNATSGVNVYGGSFDRDPSAYLIENVTSVKEEGGRWIVSLDHPENIVCYVESKAFGTLASAIKFSSTSNKTIKLENDCSEDISIDFEAKFTLDKNGHTFSGSISATAPFSLKEDNGKYVTSQPLVMIGTTAYDTFQAALDAVKDGETIKILQNKNCEGIVNEVKKFTLDWSSDSFTYSQTIYLKVATGLYYLKPNVTSPTKSDDYVSSNVSYPTLRTYCAANATSAEINVINPVCSLSYTQTGKLFVYCCSIQDAINYVANTATFSTNSNYYYRIDILKDVTEKNIQVPYIEKLSTTVTKWGINIFNSSNKTVDVSFELATGMADEKSGTLVAKILRKS